jgi:hypothetical protein
VIDKIGQTQLEHVKRPKRVFACKLHFVINNTSYKFDVFHPEVFTEYIG